MQSRWIRKEAIMRFRKINGKVLSLWGISDQKSANLPCFLTAMMSVEQCFCLQHTCVILQTQAMLT